MALKVGKDKIFDADNQKNRVICYRDVPYQDDGWVDASKFLPKDFDLVFLKTKNKVYQGWALGNGFDGLEIDDSKTIFYWKRIIGS